MDQTAFIQDTQDRFRAFLDGLASTQPVTVLCHSDVDGLAAGAILGRGLKLAGFEVRVEVTGKGESAWSQAVRERLEVHKPGALIVTDLGSRDAPIIEGVPTLLLDHHRPEGVPTGAQLITGYGQEPVPTSGIMAYWCCESITDVSDLDWIAAISLLSDIGDKAPFALLKEAGKRHGITRLREATTLLNAPRRSATGDARPALDLLLTATGPRDVANTDSPQVAFLRETKAQVNVEFAEAKRASPRFIGNVAMIRIHTPCQIHPLIAQIWRTRLPKYIVMAVNTGYLPGYVNFSARVTGDLNLIDFLREHAPDDAGDAYGHGHDQASGGALTYAAWNRFARGLGFGDEMLVDE